MIRKNGTVSIVRNDETGFKTHINDDSKEISYDHIEFLEIIINEFVGKPIGISYEKRHLDFLEILSRHCPQYIDVRFAEGSLNFNDLVWGIERFSSYNKSDIQVTINPLHVTKNNIGNLFKIIDMEFPYLFIKFNSVRDLDLIDNIKKRSSNKKVFGLVIDDSNKKVNTALLEEYKYITYNDEVPKKATSILSQMNHVSFMYKNLDPINMSVSHSDYDDIQEIVKYFKRK